MYPTRKENDMIRRKSLCVAKPVGLGIAFILALHLLPAGNRPGPAPAMAQEPLLSLHPHEVTARQVMSEEPPYRLRITFMVPDGLILQGGGPPEDLYCNDVDKSLLQIELPRRRLVTTGDDPDEVECASGGLALFEASELCWVEHPSPEPASLCSDPLSEHNWEARLFRDGGHVTDLQIAQPTKYKEAEGVACGDPTRDAEPNLNILGVYLDAGRTIVGGDEVRLEFTGRVRGIATDWGPATPWTPEPFRPHFRYRTDVVDSWTVLDDEQVEPLKILPDPEPAFVKAVAPLDVARGEPFSVFVIITDKYGNPRPFSGEVFLTGDYDGENPLVFDNEWRKEVTQIYSTTGDFKIVPEIDLPGPGALDPRSIYNYTRVHSDVPSPRRLIGDLHFHTGQGGTQLGASGLPERKFMEFVVPGDHIGQFSNIQDAMAYLEYVSGYDFGASSEHSIRWEGYQYPSGVSGDSVFQEYCTNEPRVMTNYNWWRLAQEKMQEYQQGRDRFFIFPGYEWGSGHEYSVDQSPLHRVDLFRDYVPMHRVVLFRDFVPGNNLPLLPSEWKNLPPQCLPRFLSRSGFAPYTDPPEYNALVISHMMVASEENIDWDLTFDEDSPVLSRETMEEYHRVGEIFSARAYDALRWWSPYYCALRSLISTVFEGSPDGSQTWSFRYAWRDKEVPVGVVGGSDNHYGMPGVDDARRTDGLLYHKNEPTGSTFALAASPDRDGIYKALYDRHTYVTSGIRAWLDFEMGSTGMGETLMTRDPSLLTRVKIMAGMKITKAQIWAVKVGGSEDYVSFDFAAPADCSTPVYGFSENCEVFDSRDLGYDLLINNPISPIGFQKWIYYVRAFFEMPGFEDDDPDEVLFSSPIWVSWYDFPGACSVLASSGYQFVGIYLMPAVALIFLRRRYLRR